MKPARTGFALIAAGLRNAPAERGRSDERTGDGGDHYVLSYSAGDLIVSDFEPCSLRFGCEFEWTCSWSSSVWPLEHTFESRTVLLTSATSSL